MPECDDPAQFPQDCRSAVPMRRLPPARAASGRTCGFKTSHPVGQTARYACTFRTPDMVPRKPVRFLVLLGTLRSRNGSRVEFLETACGFDSGPGRESRELAIDEAN